MNADERRFSEDADLYAFQTVRVDLERAPRISVQADAAHLPFRPECFDAVVSNHSLEHFADLDGALAEIGRGVKRSGASSIPRPSLDACIQIWDSQCRSGLCAVTAPPDA